MSEKPAGEVEREAANSRIRELRREVEVLRTKKEGLNRVSENLGKKTIRDEIERLEAENERIRENMSLRDRIREIFKKHGFTAVAVITAVSVVIGAIISNLKKGLTALEKGLGNGLKDIGKKLGEILPGMVGAIARFIFKTAGEVVGFLGKHAWLLIIAFVLYVVEQSKKRRS